VAAQIQRHNVTISIMIIPALVECGALLLEVAGCNTKDVIPHGETQLVLLQWKASHLSASAAS